MSQPLPAIDRLRWLLRTIIDAPTEYDPTPPTDETNRCSTLPGRWAYYTELDHWLQTMRQCNCPPGRRHQPDCMRQPHAHLNERYIRPHARTELVTWHGKLTIEKTGRVRGLPPNSELTIPNPRVITRPIQIARWHPWVRADQYTPALHWLLEHMHGGDTSRIYLPGDLFDASPEHITTTSRSLVAA